MRKSIIARDGRKCVCCGAESSLTVDHIRPRCLGGANARVNLMTLCFMCNNEKADLPLGAWLTTLELQGQEGITRAQRVREKIRQIQAEDFEAQMEEELDSLSATG